MKNKLTDLNNHLFAEIERLGDEEIKGDSLKEEINRAKAISSIAAQIIGNATVVLNAAKFVDERYDTDARLPELLAEVQK